MKIKANNIDKFFALSNEAFESDNESVYNDLGVSKDEYLDSKLKMIKRLKLKSKAQLNRAKNEKLEKLILTRSPQFQFRNIEKLEEGDLKELLSDLGIIDIFEDLEKLDNDN
jgi:hypothetical protein